MTDPHVKGPLLRFRAFEASKRCWKFAAIALGVTFLIFLQQSEWTAGAADPFALDGARNIIQEEHFGIVNGKLSAGVPYRNVLGVSGLWAPPNVSSDFKLDITLMGKPVATQRYTWHPFHVERAGTVQGIAVESVTMLIPGSRAGLLEITFTNPGTQQRTIPVAISVGGTLDSAGPVNASGTSGW